MSDGQLVIYRLPGTRDRARSYNIEIDGARLGRIREDEEWTTRLPAGRHTVRLRVDWVGSPTVTADVLPDEVSEVYCCSGALARVDVDILRRESYIQVGSRADLEQMMQAREARSVDKISGIAVVCVLVLVPVGCGIAQTGAVLWAVLTPALLLLTWGARFTLLARTHRDHSAR